MKTIWLGMVGLLGMLTLATTVRAEFSRGYDYEPSANISRYDQRRIYKDAIYFITSGQRNRYLKVSGRLRNYPLFPYLQYTDMAYRISRQSSDDIAQFADQYRDTPLANALVQHYLHNQGKRGRWTNFLNFYVPDVSSNRNACYYAYALAKTGKLEQAMDEARKLWLVDYSQPDECDHIFKLWRDNGHLNAETAWQRYFISIKANKVTLANYLIRFLQPEDRTFANKLKQVHTRPSYIERSSHYKQQHPRNHQIILHGLTRLARSTPGVAFDMLEKYQQQHEFGPEALTATYVSIGKRFVFEGDTANRNEKLPVDLRAHPDLVESLLRLALRQLDFSKVLVLVHLLPQDLQDHPRWQFWKARALAVSSDPADQKISQEIYEQLSNERNFYGFLSADTLDKPYNFVDKPTTVTNEEIIALEETPGIQRALELFSLGERSRARREWYFTTRDFSNKERAIAARVALRWGWYKPAIQSLIDAAAWNDLDFRFPIAYWDTFIEEARTADIPINWSLAIARQESAFTPDAKSSAGALGVMQLMPATAKLTAERTGIKYKSSSELTNPTVNIKLGSHYLGLMLRQFDNNRILASAAYNAGPGRVNRWINNDIPFDVWIETIPFLETRNYVQNVLIFSVIYSRKLALKQPMIYSHEYKQFSETRITSAKSTNPRPP